MSDISFYASPKELYDILEFVLTETDIEVYETYSGHERELKKFKNAADVLQWYSINITEERNCKGFRIAFYSPSVMKNRIITKINLKKETGHIYRYCIEGWALIIFSFEGIKDGRLCGSDFFLSNSEKRAKQWEDTYGDKFGPASDVNWDAFLELSKKLNKVIKKSSVAKTGSCYIMEDAMHFSKTKGRLATMYPIVPLRQVKEKTPEEIRKASPPRKDAICTCGNNTFHLRLNRLESVGLAACTKCHTQFYLLDSGDHWDEIVEEEGLPRQVKCTKVHNAFGIIFVYDYRDPIEGEVPDVESVGIVTICATCGYRKHQMTIEIDYSPTDTLVNQPLVLTKKINV